jgi:acid stress-induced BolA-like protein IbaG/YrbA
MPLKDTIETLIKDRASGIDSPELELEEAANGKVGGFVISTTFAGKPQLDRQNMLWDYLDHTLNREQILHIVSLVTLTPEEAKED